MRIYASALEAVKEVERDLYEMGLMAHAHTFQDKNIANDPDYDTLELLAYQYMLTHFDDVDQFLTFFQLPMEYGKREFTERIADTLFNPGRAWTARPKVWQEFIQKDGYFAYTYNERMRTQLKRAMRRLLLDPDSRQIVITIYDQHQDIAHWGGGGRVPCSMYYHLMSRVREGQRQLDLIYHMRSCDFYTHFGYDAYLAVKLLQYAAKWAHWKVGRFVHCIDSLHMFRKDWEKREEIY